MNNIYNNTEYGIYASGNFDDVINATDNWWGAVNGPYHPTENPEGNGDNVTDNVAFDPWLFAPTRKPVTFYVDDDAPDNGDGSYWNPYNNIQDALNGSEDGDSILVYGGNYYENLVVNTSISLVGNGAGETVIEIEGAGQAVMINADFVNVSGFTIRYDGSHSMEYGIKIKSNFTHIFSNKFSNLGYGIQVTYKNRGIVIEDNMFDNNRQIGVSLYSAMDSSITNNSFIGHNVHGIYLWNCTRFQIYENTIQENRYGIYLEDSHNNTILKNIISENEIGIYPKSTHWSTLKPSADNDIRYNAYMNNELFGINATKNKGSIINATMNWWGDASGPYHPLNNSNGKGDNVTDDVDFDPWLHESWLNTVFVAKYGNDINGDGTKEKPYLTIQKAINESSDGETIRVFEGVYEENVVVNKPGLSLLGNGSTTTTIDGGGSGDVVRITSDGVIMKGFNVQNSEEFGPYAGIHMLSNNNRIEENNCSDNYYGIHSEGFGFNIIINNSCSKNSHLGIYIRDSDSNEISDNFCHDNDNDGIWLRNSENNLVENNTITSNEEDGIYVLDSQGNRISNNMIENSDYAIKTSNSDRNRIENNTIINNNYGINMSCNS